MSPFLNSFSLLLVFLENSVYFYRVYVTDRSNMDALTNVQWRVNGKTVETTVVPSNANNYLITKRFSASKDQKPPRVELISFTTDNKKQQLYLNDRLIFAPAHVTNDHRGNAVSIGGSVRKRLYYFRLAVSNLYGYPARFQWEITQNTDNGKPSSTKHSRTIPAYYFNYVVSSSVEAFEKPNAVKLTSFINGTKTQIFTNDRKTYHVNIVEQQRPPFQNVFISSYVTSRKTNIVLDNPTPNDVTITWKTHGNKGSAVIPANSVKYNVPITLTGGFRNQFVLLEARVNDDGNNNNEGGKGRPVLINGNKQIRTRLPRPEPLVVDFPYKHIIFNNTLSSPVTIYGKPGAITVTVPAGSNADLRIPVHSIPDTGIMFEAKSRAGDSSSILINGRSDVLVSLDSEDVSRLVVGAKRPVQREYFIKLWLTNNHNGDVALKWTERNWQRVFTLAPRYNGEIVLSFNSDKPVTIVGNDVATNGNVYLNRRRQLIVNPSPNVKYATNVVISGEIKMFDYFYRLAVNNERDSDIEITLQNMKTNDPNNKDKPTRTTVPALSFKYGINTPLSNLNLGPNQPIRISATVKGSTAPVYINGKPYIEVLPSLNEDEATVINVGQEIPRRLYYYVFQVSSPIGKPVILRYKLGDGVERITRVPAPTESSPDDSKTNTGTFYRVAIPYKSLKRPSPIQVTAFNEKDDNRPMLINGVKTLTIEPSSDVNKKQVAYITDNRNTELPANAGDVKEFTYKATIFNPTDKDVTISWKQGKDSKDNSIKVRPGQKADLRFTDKRVSPVPVELRATTTGDNGQDSTIPLNQMSVYHLNPVDPSSSTDTGKEDTPVIRVGRITEFFVSVTNPLNIDVVLNYRFGDKTQKFSVKANSVRYMVRVKDTVGDSEKDIDRQLSAVSSEHERPLSVNQKKSLVVRYGDMHVNNNGDVVFDAAISSLTVYYVMQVENMELYPVYIVWNIDGRRGSQQITGQANAKLVIRNENPSSQKPLPISVSCYRPTRSRRLDMYLNNKKTFVVNPVYNIDKSQRVVVSSELQQVRQKYIRLEVVNKANEPVNLYWSQGSEIDFSRDNANFKRLDIGTATREFQLAFPYAVNDMVLLMATGSKNRDRFFNLNNRRQVFVQPTEKSNIMRVIITGNSK